MDRHDLFEYWQQRGSDRPLWVRENREEIHEYVDTDDPIPDGSAFEVRQWLARYKGTVTSQLNPENDESGEDTNTDDTEQGA